MFKKNNIKSREGGATFSFRHRFFRFGWNLSWRLLGAWTPTQLHAWRRMLLCLFGARLHPTAKVYPGVQVWYPPHLEMGPYACIGPGVICYSMAPVKLDAYALVSQRAHLCAGTHDVDDPDFQLVTKPIHLQANAWVAAEAFVGPGVTVGEGAVLGARAVTFKNLEPWTIYIGSPAKAVRARHSRKNA